MKFLDLAVRATKEHAQNIRDIEEKAVYYRHAKDLENARRTMMKEYYSLEDYLASGKYSGGIFWRKKWIN